MRGSKTSKNVILKKWGAPFLYPKTGEKWFKTLRKKTNKKGKVNKKIEEKQNLKKMIRVEAPENEQKHVKNQ